MVSGQKNPDFVFVDGPYAGKTVDFMWTDAAKSGQINQFSPIMLCKTNGS
ncbi:MAG: hypothetical protein ACQZ2J_10320 [Pseudomonas piscis]